MERTGLATGPFGALHRTTTKWRSLPGVGAVAGWEGGAYLAGAVLGETVVVCGVCSNVAGARQAVFNETHTFSAPRLLEITLAVGFIRGRGNTIVGA